METPSNHHPEVYALPRDHDVVPQARLEPCEDLAFLLDKYRRDVCALVGVPYEMIIGRENGNHETVWLSLILSRLFMLLLIRKVLQVRKTIASGRIFSTNMHEVCRHLQTLLRSVYCSIYKAKPEDVEFLLVPMPRLEVETIQDFKILHEIGALSPDMTVKLSRILLGEEPGGSRRPAGPLGDQAAESKPAESKPTGNTKPAAESKPAAGNTKPPAESKPTGNKPGGKPAGGS
jgi:hypothetical protein